MSETNSSQENPISETTLDHTIEVDTQSTATIKQAAANPFDPSHPRLSQNFNATVGVQVHKSGRQGFIRVHPDLDYCLETTLLEFKGDG